MVNPTIRKFLPIVTFVIATAALGFQVCVLYPWHYQLEKKFHELQEQQQTTLQEYHERKMETIKNIEQNINKLQTKIKDK